MRLVIASNNAHKVREIREILAGLFPDIRTLAEAGLSIDVVEDGETFAENAVKKAEEVLSQTDFDAALADDSGLAVDALNGAPGVHSARFAGEGHDDAANNRKLMEEMRDVPQEKRGCRFVSAVALARRGRPTLVAQGSVEGRLLSAPRGGNGFGYDPYFFYEPLGQSFAQLPADQKNLVSHRKRALTNLRMMLEREST